MGSSAAVRPGFDERRSRVTRMVWGVLLMATGSLLFLESLGSVSFWPAGRLAPALAVDGDPETRWSSAWDDPQWLRIDLGTPARITRVTLHWEDAYATRYRLEASDDGVDWRTLVDVEKGDGGFDEHKVAATGRYLRVYGQSRATQYGYSLYEVEVYGRPAGASRLPGVSAVAEPELLSRGADATASSREGRNAGMYWFVFWPLFLVAGGLPAFLVPKNSGDQVIGFLMAAAGSALLLRTLEIVSWSFRDVLPVLIAAGGLVLVVQGLHRKDPPDPSAG